MKLLPSRELFLLSKRLNTIDNTLSVHDYLGKKVYSVSGDYVGRVTDFLLYQDTFAGIIISGTKKVYIDKDYCEAGTVENILLKIDPIILLKGKIVFDSEGKRLGKVVGIERTTVRNNCDSIVIKKNIFSKPVHIPYSEVDTAKKNIILNKAY